MRDVGEARRASLRLRLWRGLGPAPHRRAVGAVRDDRHPRPAPRPAQRRDAVRQGRQGVLHRHLRRARVLPAGPLGRVHPRPGSAEALEQVAQLYFLRDGLLLGDHAGQIVRDDERDEWIVANSSWGDFDFKGVHVRHLATTDDILSGVHVLETQRTALPTEQSNWDPGMTRSTGAGTSGSSRAPRRNPSTSTPRWPSRRKAPPGTRSWSWWGPPPSAPDRGTDPGAGAGRLVVLASDGDARHYPVFDLSMRRVGRLDAPYETNIPHPSFCRSTRAGSCWSPSTAPSTPRSLMGYGGHGDVPIMRTPEPPRAGDVSAETTRASAGLVERDGAPLEVHGPGRAPARRGPRPHPLRRTPQRVGAVTKRCRSAGVSAPPGSRPSVGASTSTRTCSASSRALRDVQPRGGDRIGEHFRRPTGPTQVVVQTGTGLGVLRRCRVVRRGKPAVGHGSHRGEPTVGTPAREPDPGRRVGCRPHVVVARVEPPALSRLSLGPVSRTSGRASSNRDHRSSNGMPTDW